MVIAMVVFGEISLCALRWCRLFGALLSRRGFRCGGVSGFGAGVRVAALLRGAGRPLHAVLVGVCGRLKDQWATPPFFSSPKFWWWWVSSRCPVHGAVLAGPGLWRAAAPAANPRFPATGARTALFDEVLAYVSFCCVKGSPCPVFKCPFAGSV